MSPPSEYDAKSNLDFKEMLRSIADCYSEREDDNMEKTSVWERYDQINEWCEWYIGKYPHATPESLVEKYGENVDMRVLFMAYQIPAYSILLFLEACYEVDKAICGLDTIALESIKPWHLPQDMAAYKYLLSDEMVLWWKSELCELSNEIHSTASNRVSVSLRVRGISNAFAKLKNVIDGGRMWGDSIGTRIWTYAGELEFALPSGLFEGIYGRQELLEDALKILLEELDQREPREDNVMPVVRASSKGIETKGLRQRIPRTLPPEVTQELLEPSLSSTVSYREVPLNPNPVSIFDHLSHETGTLSGTSRYMQSVIEHASHSLDLVRTFLRFRRFREFLTHKETSLVVFSCFVVVSAVFMAISVKLASVPPSTACQVSLTSNSNFFAGVSQIILSILSVYFNILPIVRSRSLGLRYRFWFWGCLFISSLSSILSLGLYSSSPMASGVLSWTGAFSQVAITLLLTQSIDRASKAGSIDGIELHIN